VLLSDAERAADHETIVRLVSNRCTAKHLPYKDGQVKRRRARTREVCECVDYPGVNGILELGWPEPRVLQEVSEQRLFLVGYEGHEISRQ
jgi:hypothetical protein